MTERDLAPIQWPAEALWQAIEPQLPGFTVEVLPEIDSTNTELTRRARAGQGDAVLLVAERQTAGRGRLGRQWRSDLGDSLTFSFGRRMAPRNWSGLSLAAGVAIAEALDPAVRLKWPNDLWVDGCKLGGILVETAGYGAGADTARFAVVGVGLNIAPRAAEGLSTPPAALRSLWPQADAAAALMRVAPALANALADFEREGLAPFRSRFEARDLLRGHPVTLSTGVVGTACGIDDEGALLVHTAAGMQAVTSSEVSVRPVG
ncbi:MAG TPA: biotin--[acetyl-CoA-carboxylase] ligase [Ramlibacter sp.]|nr:biotin--[acetyl-CoA-carboxylase] ligase [Ramlibacter sp.]